MRTQAPLLPTLALGLLLWTAVLGTACRPDEDGPARVARVRQGYTALVQAKASPDDPRFEPLLAELQGIPPGSKAHAEAQALQRAIQGARSRPPMRPLSPVAPKTAPGSDEEAMSQEVQGACARLAELLGRAEAGPERQRLSAALGRCREQLERTKAGGHDHPPLPGDPHAGHDHPPLPGGAGHADP